MSNQITRVELNKELREFAIEDMGYAKDGCQVAIAQTLRGLITLHLVDAPFEAYQVSNGFGTMLTEILSEEQMI